MSHSSVGGPVRLCYVFLLLTTTAVALGGCAASSPSKANSSEANSSEANSSKAVATTTPSETAARSLYDLAYADTSPQQRLDLYLPARAVNPAPLLIWVHGGGWRTGDKSSIAARYDPSASPPTPTDCTDIVQVQVPDVAALIAKGYAVASINYRLDRDPVAALKDAKAAVRFLRANASSYHLDPDRFAAWGDSAGGYTVIMLGVTGGQRTVFDDPTLGNPKVSSAVQAVVDWFGPTDASSMPGNVGTAESPYTYIVAGRSLPPFRIAHGDADCIVPPQQSRHLQEALTKAGGVATLTILPGARHEDPAFMRTQLAPTVAFLDHTLGVG
jgi:acetyl esterase/lipase